MAGARTGKLPSGLTYYILENGKPEGRAYLTLAVRAGSVLEQDNEQGLAHFVEHMAFNGTTRFPESELVNYLRSLGMRFGPEVNAYTTYDETVFGIEVPVETSPWGLKTIPEKALAVIDDWTRAITFAPADVDDERAVIMEEYRSRLGAMDRFRRVFLPFIFKGSPYADRFPIGIPEIIEGAPAERLEGFYKHWYRADNMAVILAGDFDGVAMEASLVSHFAISRPDTPLNHPEYDLPAPKKGTIETLIFTDPELTYTRIDMYYKRSPLAPGTDLASYREAIIDNIIDRALSMRFDEASLNPESPYIGAGAGNIRYGKSSRYYVLIAQAKTGSAEAGLRELLKDKETLARYGVTDSEINTAKSSIISDLERLVSEKDRQESNRFVSTFTDHFINGGSCPDIEWELEAVRKLLPGIGAKEISAAIKDYFVQDDLRVILSAPDAEKGSLPAESRIKGLVQESARMEISPPKEDAVEAELLGFIPEPGEIIAESRDEETGALLWTLGNGAKVILKETKNRNNEIILYSMARGGTAGAAADEFISARLAPEMAEVSGLGPYSRPELVKKLADKQVAFSYWASELIRGFQGSATSGDLDTLFEMLYMSFTQPRIDKQAESAMMDQYRTVLAQRNENPDTVFSDEITKTNYGNNPWYKPLELADLAGADTDQALRFIKRGLNPADYTFIFTGNLDMAEIRRCVDTYLASIPSGESWNVWNDPEVVRPGKTEKTVRKGKEDRSLVYMGWFDNMPFSEELSSIASVLSEYLDIRMTEEIREKLGGVYSVSVWVSASPIPKGELIMGVYFACDPKRAEELSAAVVDLIGRAANSPIDDDTFTKSVEALKKNWETSIQSNSYIAQSYANSSVLLNLPLSRLDRRPQYYSDVTKTDIQNMARRLLPKGPVRIILYPVPSG
jgi:zinc protease